MHRAVKPGRAVLLCPLLSDLRFYGPDVLQIQLDAIADSMAVHGHKNTSPGSPRPVVRRSHPIFEVLSFGSVLLTIVDGNGRGEIIV
jgi:hypothetical protein